MEIARLSFVGSASGGLAPQSSRAESRDLAGASVLVDVLSPGGRRLVLQDLTHLWVGKISEAGPYLCLELF